ncbi:MAG: transcription repressor NadR [Clostridia bacterium]
MSTKKNGNSKEISAAKRRDVIKKELEGASGPVTANYFANRLSVSRQIIVGDVAILRASGLDILATPKGYIMNIPENDTAFPFTGIIACRHTTEEMRDELYTIVDFGATVIDVRIEHAIYGELTAKLDLSSRYDVDVFVDKVEHENNSAPISSLTGGVHLHSIGCRDSQSFERIKAALSDKGFLMN